jgi:osmotically-inducible protein OsmY
MMYPSDEKNSTIQMPPPDRNSIYEKEAVLAEVRLRFHRSPYQELHDVKCEFHEGVLTLRGRVPSAFLKQIAQSIVFSMERVEAIDNRLEIAEP